MTQPKPDQFPFEPPHVMSIDAWKRCIAAHLQLQAAQARKEAKQQ